MRLPTPTRAEALLALALLAAVPLANPYLRGEGNGHYAYLRSLAVDGDLDFENEFRRGDPDFVTSTFRRADGHPWPPMHGPEGGLRNQWASGAALLWAPAFLQVHAATAALRALGAGVSADGFGVAYRLACAIATACYGALALLLAARAAARVSRPGAGVLAAAAVWLASPLLVYMYFLPFYAHAPAAFAAAVFVAWWLARRPFARALEWGLWGAAFGLLVATDHFAAPLGVIAAAEWSRQSLARTHPAARAAAHGAAFAGGAVLAALPEMAAKWALHGGPLRSGRLTRFHWSEPQLWDAAFSTHHGAFLWTPVLLVAVAGMIALARRDARVGLPVLAAFAAHFYVVSCYELWHGTSSFGNRYLVASTPLLVVGLAAAVDALLGARDAVPSRGRWIAAAAPLALLAAWNAGLVFQWGTGMMPRQGPVDPAAVARNQLEAPRRVAAFASRYLRSREDAARQRGPAP
jgi:hypothetical protein